jgi:protein-tyrosine phosphatase
MKTGAEMIDIHAHILPGTDDGPTGLDDALRMARIAVEDGIRLMIATPHCLNGRYLNWKPEILKACEQFNGALLSHTIPLTVLPGCEVHLCPELIHKLEEGHVMTLNDGGRYICLELPDQIMNRAVVALINRLQGMGITPIISHPERNPAIQHNGSWLSDFAAAGALIQITAASLTGAFGKTAFRCCRRILDADLVDFLASDAHSPKGRPPRMRDGYEKLTSLVGEESAWRIVSEAPQAMLDESMP